MKKLACALSIVLMALGLVACGNSPDGDAQRISSTVAPQI